MRRIRFGVLVVAFVALWAGACSNQGEGERCSLDNNNEDCASGLRCQKIEGQDSPLCCPPPDRPSTVAACIPGQVYRPDSGLTDQGLPDSIVTEAASDSPGDEPQEASVEDVSLDVAKDVEPVETGIETSLDVTPDVDDDETGLEASVDAEKDVVEEAEADAGG